MKIENVEFREALEILADKAGITLPKFSRRSGADEEDESDISRKHLFEAADWVAKQYHTALLQSEEAEPVREYLDNRKVSAEAISKFKIGYAPIDRNWLLDKTKKSPNLIKALERIGNFRQEKRADFFRGRLIFPIRDEQGRTVAFGGRLVPGSALSEDDWHKDRKYLNSPDSPLFPKHKILYGLDTAKAHIKKVRRALIMEGYTDCITAHEFGFGESVAVLGTALSPEHIRLLTRMGAEKIILMLDGDAAGQAKAESDKVLIDFISQGTDMAVLTLPKGLDPCDFLEQSGAEALDELLQTQTVDALTHVVHAKTRRVDLNSIIGSTKALDAILHVIAHAPLKGTSPNDPIRLRIETTLQQLARQFGKKEDDVRRRWEEMRRKAESRQPTDSSRQPVTEYDDIEEPAAVSPDIWTRGNIPGQLEREMLELWLIDPTSIYAFWASVFPEHLASPITLLIYNQCNELIEHMEKPATFDNLMTAFDDPNMKNYLIELEQSAREKFFPDRDENLNVLREESEFKEMKEQLTEQILWAFARQEEERRRLAELNRLRSDDLSDEEKTKQLLALQQKLRG